MSGVSFKPVPLTNLVEADFQVLIDQVRFAWSTFLGAARGSRRIGQWTIESCQSSTEQKRVWIGKRGIAVTSVRSEIRTDAPLDTLRAGADPLRWSETNPFMMSVSAASPRVATADGWTQRVQEVVGSPIFQPALTIELDCIRKDSDATSDLTYDLAGPNEFAEIDSGWFRVRDEGTSRLIEIAKDLRFRPGLSGPEEIMGRHWVTLILAMQSWAPAAEMLE